MDEIQPESVSWLWRFPLGKLSIVAGDPGAGKSTLMIDIAACVTTGRKFPDGSACSPAGVVLLSAEDSAADTIRPRLDAAKADAARVHVIQPWQEKDHQIALPQDLRLVEDAIRKGRAALTVIDPLEAFLSEKTDAHKNQDIRRALAPLSSLAERTRTAIVAINHLNKTAGGKALYRVGGSIGIVGAARNVYIVMPDPNDPSGERRVFACSKTNLGSKASALAFRLRSDDGRGVARIEWLEELEISADELVREPQPERGATYEAAINLLNEMLGNGPRLTTEVESAARERGISERTLNRARHALGVQSSKRSDGRWYLSLPAQNGN